MANDELELLKRKPRRCPRCKHQPVASILYGLPNYDEETQRKSLEGRITFGGCCRELEASPHWECSQCGWLGRRG